MQPTDSQLFKIILITAGCRSGRVLAPVQNHQFEMLTASFIVPGVSLEGSLMG